MDLTKFGVRSTDGMFEAVQHVREYIEQGGSIEERHNRANTVIERLGGVSEVVPDVARVVAKYMVGQFMQKHPIDQDLARKKTESLLGPNAYLWREELIEQSTRPVLQTYTPKTTRRKGKNNTKAAAALEICKENSTLSNAELAKMIAKQLKITYANAYYYASRVFKR